MSISSDQYIGYVSRESDLATDLNDAIQDKIARNRGWNVFYGKHAAFLNGTGGSNPGVWPSITSAQRDDYINYAKKGLKTDYVTIAEGGVTVTYPVTSIDTNTPEGKWLYGTIYDEPDGQKAIEKGWDSLSESKKTDLIDLAARRRMGRDWSQGAGIFADPKTPGNDGVSTGRPTLPVYSVIDHAPVNGTNIQSIAELTSDGSAFHNTANANQVFTNYGFSHWNNYGKDESRVLPGAKFSVKNGKLEYEKEFVGSGLTANYDSIIDSFEGSLGGNYKGLIEGIGNNALKDKKIYLEDFEAGDYDLLSAYYQDEKITPLDVSTLEQPPTGGFDAAYYAGTTKGLAAAQEWNNAQNSVLGYLPDLDVVGAYGGNYDNYLHDYYSKIKRQGISDLENRGNAREETKAANTYLESWDNLVAGNAEATLAQQEMFRDQMLGLTSQGPSGEYNIDWDEPFVTDEEGNIVYEIDENGNRTPVINTDAVSFLESSVFNVFGKEDLEQQDKFKALALDVLTNAVDKLNEEKKRETELNVYMGLPGFDEIYGANSSIANSLLGDSGIGGFLSMAGVNVDQMTESLEDQLSAVTGISNNSSVYNWQKWFDETLLERYENMEEITGVLRADIEDLDPILNNSQWNSFQSKVESIDPETQPEEWDKLMDDNNLARGLSKERALEIKDPNSWKALLEKYDLSPDLNKEQATEILTSSENEINKIYTLEDDFKRTFIDEYIKPRFDQSKSMDEFISYLDTLDEDEQNVFQTQDAMQALKNVASAYSAAKLNQIKATPDAYFDSAFYFDPTVAIDERFPDTKDSSYRTQAEQVQADYEAALANPNAIVEGSATESNPGGVTWNQYAYYYGVDLADKDQFARLHYDAIGNGKGYDPAKDVTSVADIKGYIVDTVIPKVSEAQLELGDAAFSEFTTPEEFADHLLEGIDPTENNPEWKEILEQFGLDEAASLDELKEYIIDITRTGAAQEIREAIKYLNEKKLTPTQERLGVTYIEREEDANPIDEEGTSALFQIFADAGYAGTEDEFFTEFMPDADRGDIDFLTQAMGEGFSLEAISDDPFVALSQVGELMGDSDSDIFGSGSSQDDDKEEEESSYFDLFPEEDDYYNDAGRDYIKEYTSFFSS